MSWQDYLSNWRQELRARATTLRLAASYLAIIMIMSVAFSFVFYQTSIRELGRQEPQIPLLVGRPLEYGEYHEYFVERVEEGRNHLLANLLLVNMFTLVAGGVLSYLLARRTLEPIEEAMDAQARFAADASHELRTPLAAMQVENEVALRNSKLTLERAKELLRSNLEETMRLHAMAEHLLRLARDTKQPLTLVAVDVAETVTKATESIQKQAGAKHIVVENKAKHLKVLADQTSLAEVVQILLDNALKYSHDKTKIIITSEAKSNLALIHVADQGVGIDDKDLVHIFERFYRADLSRSKLNVDGNGLGLPLAQKLAEQMGGRITVTSKFGKGSTFTIELPAAKL